MELPRFLIADNEEYPENTYVLHTEKPRFILDVDSEALDQFDETDQQYLEAVVNLLNMVPVE